MCYKKDLKNLMLVLGHVKMKSGSLKIFILSWMYDLSFYFEWVLILANRSYSIKILLERWVDVICWLVLWFAQRCLANNCF